MSIQWFPGHMHSARNQAIETMETTDLVIEVIDARCPLASSNPVVETMRLHRQRACLKILNKSDLADPAVTELWLKELNAQKNTTAIAINTKKPNTVLQILPLCRRLAPHRNDGTKPLRMMIMGVPNVGKSTLMNAILKRRVANVGDEPAITKTQQRIQLDNDTLLVDTPGMLWPKIAMDSDGQMLAASHAVGVNAYYEDDVAIYLAGILRTRYPHVLQARYGIKDVADIDDVAVLERVAAQRGYRIKGGTLDFDKACHTLLLDYRSGALGGVSLETPASRAAALAAHDIAEAEKLAIKEEKERKRTEHLAGNRRIKTDEDDAPKQR
jgi:ribosome biogenesis GTPase A